jgi:hypothetical protein
VRAGAVALCLLLACRQAAETVPGPTSLGGDVVARVGDEAITRDLVGRVARARRITPRAAAEDLVADAVAANGARAVGYDKDPEVAWALESARARLVADHLRASAHARGAPTDAEVAEITARHWQVFDLPERVRVVHAVTRYPKKRSPEADSRAHAVFDAIVRAVAGAPDAAAFEERAKAVPHDRVEVVAEPLAAFVADGRSAEGEGAFDADFVNAAFSLSKPGAQTQVETRFGWHVIQLVERLPPKTTPLEERRATFSEEALTSRARKEYDGLLGSLRARYPVEVSPAAENLMKSLSVAQP